MPEDCGAIPDGTEVTAEAAHAVRYAVRDANPEGHGAVLWIADPDAVAVELSCSVPGPPDAPEAPSPCGPILDEAVARVLVRHGLPADGS